MKKIALFVFILVVLTGVMASCEKNALEGTYACYVGTMKFRAVTFYSDNACEKIAVFESEPEKATYEMSGTKIVVEYNDGTTEEFEYDKKTDTLLGSGDLTYVRE